MRPAALFMLTAGALAVPACLSPPDSGREAVAHVRD